MGPGLPLPVCSLPGMGEVFAPCGATSRVPSGARASSGPPQPRACLRELVGAGRFSAPAVSWPHSLCCSHRGVFCKPATSFSVPSGHFLIVPGGLTAVRLSEC
ncbi:hypothetical protein NDU88_004377 [Pleurodeles waltl]|uniref:Uncharacterized protein n=1 Tax=Pleurodeles waltl TaxID=8319 RepID=A0AAV7QC44_PLEWA|nr:hypothetical protein NDU88_004377 [Pleurodeles waltl]